MKNDVVYKITTEDVQEVALKEIGRELSADEIKTILNPISDNIKWYDAVADAINSNIRTGEPL